MSIGLVRGKKQILSVSPFLIFIYILFHEEKMIM